MYGGVDMREAIEVINDILGLQIEKSDLEQNIQDAMDWDSFEIMRFMTQIFERYAVTVNITQISMIDTVRDLVELVVQCMDNNDN